MPDRTDGLFPDAPATPKAPSTVTPAPSGDRTGGLFPDAPPAPKPAPAVSAAPAGNYGTNDLSGALLQRAMSSGTFGLTDWAGAGVNAFARATGLDSNAPTLAQIKAQNEQVYQEHPYLATGADAAGYTLGAGKVLGPLGGKLAPFVGRYGAAALEGGTAGGLSSVGSQLGSERGVDPYAVGKGVLTGGAAGVGGQAIGDITAPAVRRVADYVTGKPGRVAGGYAPLEETRRAALAGNNAQVEEVLANMRQSRFVAPGSAADNAIQSAADAAAMSTNPGWMARGVRGGTTLGAGGYGYLHGGGWEGLLGSSIADRINASITNPLANVINRADRRININQAFDAIYPAFGESRTTTNVAPWSDALRQLAVGAVQ